MPASFIFAAAKMAGSCDDSRRPSLDVLGGFADGGRAVLATGAAAGDAVVDHQVPAKDTVLL